MRIQLTKDWQKVAMSYGLIQNASSDSNVELTENIQSEGIVLRAFQVVTVNQTVWARKLSGAGTSVLAALPFMNSDNEDETSDGKNTSLATKSFARCYHKFSIIAEPKCFKKSS